MASGFSGTDIPSFEILNTCVKCGLCLPACPTYRETGREQSSPRGRIHLMQSVHEGRTDVLDPTFVEQAYECLDCRACEAVCPSGVKYGQVIEDARTQIERARERRGHRGLVALLTRRLLLRGILGDFRLLRLAARALRLYQQAGLQRLARRSGLLRRLRLERLEAQLPPLGQCFFTPRDQVFRARGARRGRVGLLAGCIMHVALPEVDRATVRVLTENGWDVLVPAAQGCCGALHVHAGAMEWARERARANIAAFEAAPVDYVVNNAAGCGAALKEYGRLLARDAAWAERAAAFSARVRDVTELLASAPLRGEPRIDDLTVTYQDPCHLAHAQGVAAAPRSLLRSIAGLRLIEMADADLCCGSAGVYSLTHAEMSGRLLRQKLERVRETGAQIVATANPGCMLQLRAGLRGGSIARPGSVAVRHVVEILAAALERNPSVANTLQSK